MICDSNVSGVPERARAQKEAKNHTHSRPGAARGSGSGGRGVRSSATTDVCRHFLLGKCTRNPCRFSHPIVVEAHKTEVKDASEAASPEGPLSPASLIEVEGPGPDMPETKKPSEGDAGAPDDGTTEKKEIDLDDLEVVELRCRAPQPVTPWATYASLAVGSIIGATASLIKFTTTRERVYIAYCTGSALFNGSPTERWLDFIRRLHGIRAPARDFLFVGAAATAACLSVNSLFSLTLTIGDTMEQHKEMVSKPSYIESALGWLWGGGRQNPNHRRDFQSRRGLDNYAMVTVHRGLVEFLVKRFRRSNIEAHLPRSWYRVIEEYTNALQVDIVDNSVRHAHQLLYSAHMQDQLCGLVVSKPMPVGRPN